MQSQPLELRLWFGAYPSMGWALGRWIPLYIALHIVD
jgi:hypothetical protein